MRKYFASHMEVMDTLCQLRDLGCDTSFDKQQAFALSRHNEGTVFTARQKYGVKGWYCEMNDELFKTVLIEFGLRKSNDHVEEVTEEEKKKPVKKNKKGSES